MCVGIQLLLLIFFNLSGVSCALPNVLSSSIINTFRYAPILFITFDFSTVMQLAFKFQAKLVIFFIFVFEKESS